MRKEEQIMNGRGMEHKSLLQGCVTLSLMHTYTHRLVMQISFSLKCVEYLQGTEKCSPVLILGPGVPRDQGLCLILHDPDLPPQQEGVAQGIVVQSAEVDSISSHLPVTL